MFLIKKRQISKPRYLGIVGSPFQLLCILERSWRDDENDIQLIIIDNGNERNLDQVKEILAAFTIKRSRFFRKYALGTGSLFIIKILNFIILPLRLKVWSWSVSLANFEKILIGHSMPHLAYLVPKKFLGDLIRVDDGTGTLELYDRVEREDLKIAKNMLARLIYINLLRFPKISSFQFELFTIFPTVKAKKFVTTVTDNDFSILKQKHAVKASVTNEIWILGTPYEFYAFYDASVPQDLLQKTIRRIRELDCIPVYIPHRMESNFKVEANLNIQVRSLPLLEWHLLNSSRHPRALLSFFSTALVSAKIINPAIDCMIINVEKYIDSKEIRSVSRILRDEYHIHEFEL